MKTTIVIGDEHQFSVLKMSEKNRYFFYTLSEPEAHLYHIEHPEVDSYIVISKQFTKKKHDIFDPAYSLSEFYHQHHHSPQRFTLGGVGRKPEHHYL